MKGALAHASKLPLAPKLVAKVERTEPDPCPEPGTSEHTDEEFRMMVEERAEVPRSFDGIGAGWQLYGWCEDCLQV
jgi:hypothetical protein